MLPREYPTRPIVGVGAVVYVSPGDAARLGLRAAGVILIKRRYEPLAGEWSIPGGTIEVGERLDEAVAREVLEETGLRVEVGPVIDVFDRIMLDDRQRVQYHFVLIDYLCRPVSGRLEAGTDAGDVTVADPSGLGPFGLTAKTSSVIARGVALAQETP